MQISTNKFFTPFKLAALLFSLALASCGGGSSGGGGAGNPETLSGTAATGAALVGDVNVYGKNGGKILDILIDASGKYSTDVAGLTAPYLICAVPDDNNLETQYSYANTPGTANVTPLTTLALFYANNEQDLAPLTSTWPAKADAVFAETATTQKIVNANFADRFPTKGIDFTNYDFLTTPFNIGDGLDQILDELNIILSGVTPVIEIPSIPGFSFDDVIDTGGIDIGGILGGGTGTGSGSVTISGAGTNAIPTSSLSYTPTSVSLINSGDTGASWTDGNTVIGIVIIEGNITQITAASTLNVSTTNFWRTGTFFSTVSGTSYDGTTATFNNVTLTTSDTGAQPITLNGSLSK